jgi:multidrug efflux pump subunit AcrA (membrane-fusion protein)
MKSLRIVIGIGVLILAALLAAVALFNRPASAAPLPPTRVVAPSKVDTAPTSVKAIGMFASANQAMLAFQTAGRVKEIKVKEGDKVKAGTLLASLDAGVLDAQVMQAQAGLDTAQARLDQLKSPTATDIAAAQASVSSSEAAIAQLRSPTQNDLTIAKSDVDKAKAAVGVAQAAYDRIGGLSNPFIAMTPQALALQQATLDYQKAVAVFNSKISPSDSQLKQAQAAVDQARAQLARLTSPSPNDIKSAQAVVTQAQAALDAANQNASNARIVAPFDGTALWIAPHVGDSATPNAAMISFADLSQMQVLIGVDENTLAQLNLGQTASITADALPGKTFTGHIGKIGFLATTTAGIISLPVTINVDDTSTPIAPGLSASVEINIGK